VEGRSFSLDKIKAIRETVDGATVNDVVLSICGGALRKYLEAKKELPDETLIAMAPISVRSEDQKGAAGNQVSAMTVAVHTDIKDPAERLQAVYESTTGSKELTNAIGARLMTDFSQFIPSSTAGLAARLYSRMGLANRMNPYFNCVITNIPGPQVPLYCCGARLVTQFGLGPILDGMGLIFPVFSYCGQLTISVTSCRDMIPDPAFFAECLEASFNEMATLAGADVPTKKETKIINWTHDSELLEKTPKPVKSKAKSKPRRKRKAKAKAKPKSSTT
jgi:WS/DGAT/MGAT family acyltransferase